MKNNYIKFILLINTFVFFTQLAIAQIQSVISNKTNAFNAYQEKNQINPSVKKYVFANSHLKNMHCFLETTSAETNLLPTLEVTATETKPLTAKEIDSIKPFIQLLTSNFDIHYTVETARFQKTLYASINAYRLNPNTSAYEKLIDYTFNWNYQIKNTQVQNTVSKTSGIKSYATESVLKSGQWYKIGLTKTGVYKLTPTLLGALGIDVQNINPKNIRVYGNGGKQLPALNSIARPDDLLENAIEVVGEADNKFDANDYVLFYGQSTDSWTYKSSDNSNLLYYHTNHDFSDTSFYFINVDMGPGKRIQNQESRTEASNKTTNSFDYMDYYELNAVNLLKSGKEFFGEAFDIYNTYNFPFNIPNPVIGDSIKLLTAILSQDASNSKYKITTSNINDTITVPLNGALPDYLAPMGIYAMGAPSNTLNSAILNVTITKLSPSAKGWLDYVQFNCRSYLNFNANQFVFSDSRVLDAPNSFAKYTFTTTSGQDTKIWDVTTPSNIFNQLYNVSANASLLDFTAPSSSLKKYAVFKTSQALTPTMYGTIKNQNLHALTQADYIIVTHPLFIDEANKLAKLHFDNEGFSSAVVTTQDIYNEYSSGTPDIVAIRDFVKMLYTRPSNTLEATKHLLLFGDGSYDNKNLNIESNSALIPTFQYGEICSQVLNVVADDFYGMMDNTEGNLNTGVIDIGVGRIVSRTKQEAQAVVNKIEQYYKKNTSFDLLSSEAKCSDNTNSYPQGDWRNKVTFIADDQGGNMFINDSEGIINKFSALNKTYIVNKIYIDAYQQYSTPGGHRYPDAVSEINKTFENGSLFVCYTGHGGELGLAEERIIDIPQILSWTNINNLPLFVTATCEFTRFDDPSRTSAGEFCLLNPKGGAIALFTTIRTAYANIVQNLNLSFAAHINTHLANGQKPTLGDIYRLLKKDVGNSILNFNFSLIGDPALTLAYPKEKVYTKSINGSTIKKIDTLKALSKITVTGFVGDVSGKKLSNYNGVLFPTLYDKQVKLTTLANDLPASKPKDYSIPQSFNITKSILYKGKVSVTNGDFSFTFLVPKDIDYTYGKAYLSYYANNGVIDAQNLYDSIIVGGSNPNAAIDTQGPSIKLYMNDEKFVIGGLTNEKPKIYAVLLDSSGINTTGNSLGHDATVILDANTKNPIILNDYYIADLNSYQAGKIHYPFNNLAEGKHTIDLKVWDNQNNSSVAYTEFFVTKEANLVIKNLLNYPNPFTTNTKFFIEHNQCCTGMKLLIHIYTISGKLVKSISASIDSPGFRIDNIEWDGKDDFGDKLARGVYVYKLTLTDNSSKTAEKYEKLVILN